MLEGFHQSHQSKGECGIGQNQSMKADTDRGFHQTATTPEQTIEIPVQK